MRKSSILSIAFAVVLGAAFSVPAQAEERLPDFDQGVNVGRFVKNARSAVASDETKLEGESRQIQAMNEGDIVRKIVVFRKGSETGRRMNIIRQTGGIPQKNLWLVNAVSVVMPKSRLQSFKRGLASFGEVLRVEDDFIQNWLVNAPAMAPVLPVNRRADIRPDALKGTAPETEEQKTPWGIDRVHAAKAWETTRGGGVKLAVVDTGIDHTHTDLKVVGGFNTIDNAADFKDDNGHGTHVAGTIAGSDNDEGVVGVAPDVLLYGVKVLSASGSGTFADVIEGIQWTVENKMDVANFSLGASQGTQALADAVQAAADGGVALICAAGNSGGSVGFPAAYPGALAVAASDSGDRVAYFSSRGPEVDVIAPGVGINSTWMGGGYKSISGTSMATPHVAGLAALAVASRGLHGIDAIRKALREAASPIGEFPAEQQGAGMPDAGRLVNP